MLPDLFVLVVLSNKWQPIHCSIILCTSVWWALYVFAFVNANQTSFEVCNYHSLSTNNLIRFVIYDAFLRQHQKKLRNPRKTKNFHSFFITISWIFVWPRPVKKAFDDVLIIMSFWKKLFTVFPLIFVLLCDDQAKEMLNFCDY